MPDRVDATPLLDKLGVLPGARVAIVGQLDPAFIDQLADRTQDIVWQRPRHDSDLILLAADSIEELAALAGLRTHLRQAGAIWVVTRKGRSATIRDVEVIAAARDVGLVDNKVASFSDTHTALRLVIPKRLRVADG